MVESIAIVILILSFFDKKKVIIVERPKPPDVHYNPIIKVTNQGSKIPIGNQELNINEMYQEETKEEMQRYRGRK